MSKFSSLLEKFISRSGEPLARIAKNAGVERTSIHKALKDERILPYSSLNKLIQYFQLTLPEARELSLCYDMILLGEETYKIHSEIRGLMSDLSNLTFFTDDYQIKVDSKDIVPTTKIIYGEAEIHRILLALLYAESASHNVEIRVHCGCGTLISNSFIQLWRNGKNFSVHQIVPFRPDGHNANALLWNIQNTRKLLPTALLSNNQYNAYYYYTNCEEQNFFSPFPYYIVTPKYLILINGEYSVAYVSTDTELVRHYQKHFDQWKKECLPLTSYSSEPFDVLSSYMENSEQRGYYTIMTQPCIGRHYTKELINKYIRPELPYRQQLIEMSIQRFGVLRQINDAYYTVFNENGLLQLVNDAFIADLPKAQVLPLSTEDRLNLLVSLREDIAEDIIHGLVAKPDQLSIPQYLTFTCDPNHGIHIYAIDGFVKGSYSCNLHLSVGAVGTAFCDFIRFLPNSDYVYAKEETLSIIDSYIDMLKRKFAKEE